MSKHTEAALDLWGRPLSGVSPAGGPGSRLTGMADALTTAARRVFADRDSWRSTAISAAEVEEKLEHLRTVLQEGDLDRLRPGERAADLALQRRLLDLLRRELLQGAEGAKESELLTTLSRIETVQAKLEPKRHQSMASMLMGVNSRDLVVELAHDLRSPLTSIMFLAETLRKGQSGEINDVQRQQVGIIYSASLNLVSIASDLIDLAREGDFVTEPYEPEPFSLAETFDSVHAMVAPMAHEKRLHLHFYSPDRDTRLGSAARLSRVLLNLAANAIKFTETGRVEVVAVERGPSCIEFSVRDTGRGMDEKTLDNLFQPFRRSESQTGFQFSGTGLGLSICRRLVEVMGAELHVESRPGYGTRFFFELEMPRVRPE
ncbi:MAG: sensor histidine kinase [Gemmatimonadota bacterium]